METGGQRINEPNLVAEEPFEIEREVPSIKTFVHTIQVPYYKHDMLNNVFMSSLWRGIGMYKVCK